MDKYPDRNLVLRFPEYKERWTLEALERFQGQYLIYSGGGVKEKDRPTPFGQVLWANYDLVKEIKVPMLLETSDAIWIFQRKGSG